MAFTTGPGQRRITCEINVTPLVDVILVLLIIFMVVTPMLHRGKEVELPQARQVEKERSTTHPLTVAVLPGDALFLDDRPVELSDLEEQLRREVARDPSRPILVKGDRSLDYEPVRQVLRAAQRAGASGVSLGVRELVEGSEGGAR
ncbi:MAG: biopolymer transporter ExbD [Deltaproteobacteria bacterium]|nr:biopolymer transporter ExbD [Deltaproteobacteria bacterium]